MRWPYRTHYIVTAPTLCAQKSFLSPPTIDPRSVINRTDLCAATSLNVGCYPVVVKMPHWHLRTEGNANNQTVYPGQTKVLLLYLDAANGLQPQTGGH